MGSTYNGQLFSVIEEQKQPVEVLWDAQVLDLDGWIIPAGLTQARLARVRDFVRFATETQRLADQASYISYGPARASSAVLVRNDGDHSNDMTAHMPTDPSNIKTALLNNQEFWLENGREIDTEFDDWINKSMASGGKKSDYKAKVNVLFGTTREANGSNDPTMEFVSSKYSNLKYGFVEVLVPENHVIGDTSNGTKETLERSKEAILGKVHADEFKLENLEIISRSQFSNYLQSTNDSTSKSGFVYVHGFATTFEFAAQRTAQIAFDLQPFIAAPMFFSWPSEGVRSRRSYEVDENMIEPNRRDLANFLEQAVSAQELETVHIIAHSLGARLLSEALEELNRRDPAFLRKIGEIVLAAPDISSQSFENNFVQLFAESPARTTIYASEDDWALIVSDSWHGATSSSLRLGEVRPDMLLFEGIDTIDITGLQGSFGGHSVVQQNPTVLSDLFWILSTRYRPHKRCCLEERSLGSSQYWKLKGN